MTGAAMPPPAPRRERVADVIEFPTVDDESAVFDDTADCWLLERDGEFGVPTRDDDGWRFEFDGRTLYRTVDASGDVSDRWTVS